jgi:hypothetical protein
MDALKVAVFPKLDAVSVVINIPGCHIRWDRSKKEANYCRPIMNKFALWLLENSDPVQTRGVHPIPGSGLLFLLHVAVSAPTLRSNPVASNLCGRRCHTRLISHLIREQR